MSIFKSLSLLTKLFFSNPKYFYHLINSTNLKLLWGVVFASNATDRARLLNLLSNIYPVHSASNSTLTTPSDIESVERTIPSFDHIDVSIIVPVYNQWELTDNCLKSIIYHVKSVNYEIILADDGSSDKTTYANTIFKNLVVVRPEKNQGFLLNCNLAATHAKGRYIMLLNNDTLVNENWLESLFNLMEQDENIAISGSKLVYPDGKLQEAGGIIWQDGSGWNYGRMSQPGNPEYNYVKEVDYISGASILLRTSFWLEVDGFDDRYVPAYYEDTDLAFEASSRGYKVVYHPHSVVVHFEGRSHGTDANVGIKAYQVENQKKFNKKWQNKLQTEHFPNAEHLFHARDKSQNKRTILIIDHYVPMFDKDAGSRSTYMYVKALVNAGYNVKFIGDNFYPHQPYTDNLNALGVEVLLGNYFAKNWQHWIKEHAQYIDVVFMHRPHISEKYLDFLTENTTIKTVYQCHDLHYVRMMRDYENTGNTDILKKAQEWEKIERKIFNAVDLGLTFSLDEKILLQTDLPQANVEQVPLFLYDELETATTGFTERDGMMFVGGFSHKPNAEGVLWFVENIMPQVIAKYPDIKLYIAGNNVPNDIETLASKNIVILGFITDERLQALYQQVKVNILPLLHGAGVKGKLIESMQTGTPVVSTSIGLEGIGASNYGFSGFDSKEEFTNEVIKLISCEYSWYMCQKALSLAFASNFSVTEFNKRVRDIF
jgi:GT2 family glycosyltransferase